MSLSTNGRQLCCDSEGCAARVSAPVAFHATSDTPDTRWLFVRSKGMLRHYCPRHTAEALRLLRSGPSLEEHAEAESAFPP